MVSDAEDVSFHSPSPSSSDSEMEVEVDETRKTDEILIEAHDWLSANMSVNPFNYQLGDQALQKNLGGIPRPEEQYLWVPKVDGIPKSEMSVHAKRLDAALEKVQRRQKGISQGQGGQVRGLEKLCDPEIYQDPEAVQQIAGKLLRNAKRMFLITNHFFAVTSDERREYIMRDMGIPEHAWEEIQQFSRTQPKTLFGAEGSKGIADVRNRQMEGQLLKKKLAKYNTPKNQPKQTPRQGKNGKAPYQPNWPKKGGGNQGNQANQGNQGNQAKPGQSPQ
ncbi:hypothetical protein IWQ62_005102 [Dispira parvispora]|uniref:Uncharacterized protein n=1 Tax=Dispira parvispora TaxID=1520584 RepID=A0A9W8ARH2_9FUNG|nr:hypothetical protein IWQ62_005102 [Dispira parvispora]